MIKSDHALIELTLPVSGDRVRVRRYTVRDEKILLMALQDGSRIAALLATKQIIQNCVIEPENFDVDTLSIGDFEWLFLQLYIHSVSDTITLRIRGKKLVPIKLTEVKIDPEINETRKIIKTGDYTLVLRPPPAQIYEQINPEMSSVDAAIEIASSAIESIEQGDAILPRDMYDPKEFLLDLPPKIFNEISAWVLQAPRIYYKLPEDEIELRGLSDFFTF